MSVPFRSLIISSFVRQMEGTAPETSTSLSSCVVCDRPLPPSHFVLNEIAGYSLSQHLPCFCRSIVHGYRVLNPSSRSVIVTVANSNCAKVSLYRLIHSSILTVLSRK